MPWPEGLVITRVFCVAGVGDGFEDWLDEGDASGEGDGVESGEPESKKTAVAVFAEDNCTVQVAVNPLQSPDQRSNREPAEAEAVKTTCVPEANLAESYGAITPREIPAGVELTVPRPEPDLYTVKRYSESTCPVNFAVTLLSESMTIVQDCWLPEQPPDHPSKTALSCAVAVSEISLPESKDSTQAAPHKIPEGDEETKPLPCAVTESWNETADEK
ncbi:MAG TPA: hypothetical protein VI875_02075 [Candidatus Norongarragalinales archaeon]|nr:hypothetical protein [Candidatus Norongarragalinales archaeon]